MVRFALLSRALNSRRLTSNTLLSFSLEYLSPYITTPSGESSYPVLSDGFSEILLSSLPSTTASPLDTVSTVEFFDAITLQ